MVTGALNLPGILCFWKHMILDGPQPNRALQNLLEFMVFKLVFCCVFFYFFVCN